jgi:Na+-translocating ferredoxin:NAD+ oxidoreductase subunit G
MMALEQKKKIKSLMAMLVVTAMLAGTIFGLNLLLADQFEKNAQEAERKIPRLVLPSGNIFDLYEGTLVNDVSACYVAANGAGIAVVVDRETSRGDIQIMVGVNSEGQITAVSILDQEYTEGNDAEINDPDYLSVYIGRTVLSASHIGGDYEIDPVAGADEASDAVYQAVKTAFLQQAVIENEMEKETKEGN